MKDLCLEHSTARHGGMTGTKMINATFRSHRKTKASKIYKQFYFIKNFADTNPNHDAI